ncbi:MAG: hypothetical protein WB664_04455 [Nitrososphaeraceae archaeon]
MASIISMMSAKQDNKVKVNYVSFSLDIFNYDIEQYHLGDLASQG